MVRTNRFAAAIYRLYQLELSMDYRSINQMSFDSITGIFDSIHIDSLLYRCYIDYISIVLQFIIPIIRMIEANLL